MRFVFHSDYQKDITTSPMESSRLVPLCFPCLPMCCPLYWKTDFIHIVHFTRQHWRHLHCSGQNSQVLQSRGRGDSIHPLDELCRSPKRNFHFQNSCFGRTLDGTAKDWSEPAALTVWTTQHQRFYPSEAAHHLFWGTKDHLYSAALGTKNTSEKSNCRFSTKTTVFEWDERGRFTKYLSKELFFDHSTWSKCVWVQQKYTQLSTHGVILNLM